MQLIYVYKNKRYTETEIISRDISSTDVLSKPIFTREHLQENLYFESETLKNKILSSITLTKDEILSATPSDFTEILRVASFNNSKLGNETCSYPVLLSSLKKIGLNPLPILPFIKGTKTKISLAKHQIEAILYVLKREKMGNTTECNGLQGSILKLAMGLGKTLISIAASFIAPGDVKKRFPTLVVTSKTIINTWKTDGFEKFFGDNAKVLYLHKDHSSEKEINSITREKLMKYDFVMISYNMMCNISKTTIEGSSKEIWCETQDFSGGKIICTRTRKLYESNDETVTGPGIIFRTPWERVIFDESTTISNHETMTYKSAMSLYGNHKLCLSGVLIKNGDLELWAQLRICGYSAVRNHGVWTKNGKVLMNVHKLSDAILSMEYNDTEIIIPEKKSINYVVSLTGLEKRVYDIILKETKETFMRMMDSKMDYAKVLGLFTRLRQACIAPYLITEASKRVNKKKKNSMNETVEGSKPFYLRIIEKDPELRDWIHDPMGTAGIGSLKITTFINSLKKIPVGDKCLIFSSFTSALDLCKLGIINSGLKGKCLQLDGDTKGEDRLEILDKFKNDKSYSYLLMTYKVGSEGINITTASCVLSIDLWWNDAAHDQAARRCWRPGQTKEVFVYNIYVANSIEDKILQICESKKNISEEFLKGSNHKKSGELVSKNSKLDKETMQNILFT